MKRKKRRRRLYAALEALTQAQAVIVAERDDLAYRLAMATRRVDEVTAERDDSWRHLAEVYEVLDEGSADTDRAPDGSRRSAAQRVKLLVERLRCPADILEALRLEALRRERDEAAAEVERLRAMSDAFAELSADEARTLYQAVLDCARKVLANGAAKVSGG